MTRSHATSHAQAGVARQRPSAPLLGQVNEWELVALAGKGSLTEVYRARPAGAEEERPVAYAVKLLRAEWQGPEGSRRRKFYSITEEGRRRLERELQGWRAFTRHVNQLLGVERSP